VKALSRRQFLMGLAGATGATLVACAPKTVIVEKEKIIKETVVVKEEVEKKVMVTRGEPSWTPPDLSGQEWLMWGLQYDLHIEAYERLAKRFEELTGAKATIEPQAWPIENNIITGMATGLVPDACCIMGKQIAPLIDQEAIESLDEMYNAIGCDINTWFGPVGLQAYQYGGKTYGVPTEGNCVSGVSNVRLDFVEEAGAEALWPPLNGKDGFRGFEDMFELAQALQKVDKDGNVTRWGMSSEGWDNRDLFGIMRTLGRDWWDPESRTFGLDTDEATEALYLLAYKPIWELGIEAHMAQGAEDSMMASKVALANGNVTMPPTGRGEGIPIDSCVYPSAIPGRDALFVGEGGWGFIVPSQAHHKDIGIEFMKFLSTYEGNKLYCQIYGGITSAVLSVNNDDELFPRDTLVGDAMRRAGIAQARTVYYGSGYGNPSEMEGISTAAVEKVRIGEATPKEALKEAQGLLEEMLARWDAAH